MSTTHDNQTTTLRLSLIDDDPLRARREARELLAELADVAPGASLDVPRSQEPLPSDAKGGEVVGLIGVVFSGGSLAIAAVQLWLSRVPQRTVSLTRPDGTSLEITGRQSRTDAELLQRFITAETESPSRSSSDHSSTPQ